MNELFLCILNQLFFLSVEWSSIFFASISLLYLISEVLAAQSQNLGKEESSNFNGLSGSGGSVGGTITSTMTTTQTAVAVNSESSNKGSSTVADASASGDEIRTGPYVDMSASKNVTALLGKTVYLNCRVKNLGNKTVSLEGCVLRCSSRGYFNSYFYMFFSVMNLEERMK